MGKFSERGQGHLRTVNEINVTPLMDLTFLLLIVFMITAPVLEYETDVTPPEMNTAQPVDEELEPLLINLNKEGDIVFQRSVVSLETLAQKLEFMRQTRPDVSAIIRADGERPYKEVIGVMRTVREAGVGEVKLATQPES